MKYLDVGKRTFLHRESLPHPPTVDRLRKPHRRLILDLYRGVSADVIAPTRSTGLADFEDPRFRSPATAGLGTFHFLGDSTQREAFDVSQTNRFVLVIRQLLHCLCKDYHGLALHGGRGWRLSSAGERLRDLLVLPQPAIAPV